MTTPAEPRPASTVVVLRALAEAYEVLLVRRNDRVAFMAGAFVFPGGRVDAADREPTARDAALPQPRRFLDLSAADEMGYRRAAVRELEEEAAVLVPVDALVPFAHWVTPGVEPRRYDTRFFLTLMPAGQEARHDEGEMTELVWCSPSEALERALRGHMRLPPPTWTTLRQLERHVTLASAMAWAQTTPIVRVEPGLVTEGDRRILTLPGDPTFPTLAGWVVPDETRFSLDEGGGWLPVRP
jgi:8-oxo-dGTP pyrophosphatase MutT (NUDIX family)